MSDDFDDDPTDYCANFNGFINKQCHAGVAYDAVRDQQGRNAYWPCLVQPCGTSARTTCSLRRSKTSEEIAAQQAEIEATTKKLFVDKLSLCCDAPFDESKVNDRGGGWRYCSKCGKEAFHSMSRHQAD